MPVIVPPAIFNDGRERPPLFNGEESKGLLVRLNLVQTDENSESLGDPIYGKQFQNKAILGIQAEGKTLHYVYASY
ncbi:MAG: CxxC motif-containing protein (DUF1111 family) [Patiriisocius sp.]|jgi:CxxC motif-containing protein (DUF1111 family)